MAGAQGRIEDLRLLQIITCNTDESWTEADEEIVKAIQEKRVPTNRKVGQTSYFFLKLITKLHEERETMIESERKICDFLINRLHECNRILAIYFNKTTGGYYLPGFQRNEACPPLEERRHFPKLKDHRGPGRPSDNFLFLIGLSKRVKKFMLTVNQFLRPDEPKFVIYYHSLRSTSGDILNIRSAAEIDDIEVDVENLVIS